MTWSRLGARLSLLIGGSIPRANTRFISPHWSKRKFRAAIRTAAAKRLEAVANIPSILITSETQLLTDALVASKAVPDNSVRDALHIAIAATQGIDYLLTWNFKHINNAETKALITHVVEADGWVCPILCSPEELGGDNYEE
ncbi:MAG: hypothetical protein MZW92_70825 [Comamonadaceae bacterium]|nr:hypothetical protein [Comamonadaceae bacterium]